MCFLSMATASALPPERAYEMVSPPYKGGYGSRGIVAVAPQGNAASFTSVGAFAGAQGRAVFNEYVARRTAAGWETDALVPPAEIAPFTNLGAPVDLSATLQSSLALTALGPNAGAAESLGVTEEFLLHDTSLSPTAANFTVAGQPLETVDKREFPVRYLGASADLSHILFGIKGGLGALLPGVNNSSFDLYELAVEKSPSLRLVAVDDKGEQIDSSCPIILGNENIGKVFGAISDGGEEIFFEGNAKEESKKCDATVQGGASPDNPAILYARLGGKRTLEISKPLPSQCAAKALCDSASQARAEFESASEDGTRVYFKTAQPLVTEDTDEASDLYMATIACPGGGISCEPSAREVSTLTQVSHDPHGEPADVQGVLSVSADGSHVYFVASGVLSDGPNAEGLAPARGADNLYVYDTNSAGAPVFVADLCSGPEASGEVKDVRCPPTLEEAVEVEGVNQGGNDTRLWLSEVQAGVEAQTAGAGRFLLFSSFGRLLPSDTDAAKDVYRYDAVAGTLERVSVGEGGHDANGNADVNAQLRSSTGIAGSTSGDTVYQHYGLDSRAISEDGTRVVFSTAEPLSPDAINGLEDIYEWHKEPNWSEATVSLVSTGRSILPENVAVMSASGMDLMLDTVDRLLPQDTDEQVDVYDERLGGGFPSSLVPPEPCSGDACQGPLSAPAPVLLPDSAAQALEGDRSAHAATSGRSKHVVSRHRSSARRKRSKVRRRRHRHVARSRINRKAAVSARLEGRTR
jgi:hypothetical protein